ncbi:flagellar biosynthetic protein FliO [Ruminococcaceae bacterium OttesenSCG-928-L11]|nr:flagellar biosynthetic protein FliO [Ruminococcaceae bacterium OttesenSCG-928-L11]
MGFMDIMQLVGSLVVIALVLVATYYGSRWYARRMGSNGPGKYVRIIDKTALGQGSAIAIVKAGESYYLIGLADKSVSLLSELPDFHEEEAGGVPSTGTFRQMFGASVKNRTSQGESISPGIFSPKDKKDNNREQ